ncbi:MAG: PepSY-associated TM helix domain-containing protein [Pseudomonadota bacterium]|nr:PepSY-associated TM helix domain-containing protein [Pseudomonadota bacterium]
MTVNLKRLLRQIHYWLSLAVAVPAVIMFVAGIFLMLKKEVAWIQPPTTSGIVSGEVPEISLEQMLDAARAHPEAQIAAWTDIDRIDLRVGKGVAKLRANSGWEVQVDTNNGEVLSVAYRRSDIIEQIHDGSFFSDTVKLYIFLPTGVLLILMWGTGLYLFLLPRIQKKKKPLART